MTNLSTHVLDTGTGRPWPGVPVVVEREEGESWIEVGRGITDRDGRIGELAAGLDSGVYRLRFVLGEGHFYPEVSIVARLDGDEPHYHLPLLVAAFGYTTYRGS